MALAFWTEPIPSYDLDVLLFLAQQEKPIVSLRTIHQWAAVRGYPVDGEDVIVESLPAQCLPSHNGLAGEAMEKATTLDYEGVAVRVVRPEDLVVALPRALGAYVLAAAPRLEGNPDACPDEKAWRTFACKT
jgi:hypothetical protein